MYTSEFNLTLLNRSQRAIDRLSTRRVSLFYNSKIGQDANDTFYTAQNYFFGRHNFDQDFVEAFKYYREAAELGHGLAVTLVGFCYEFGYGVSIDYSKAEKYYMVALESYVEPFALCRMAFLRKYGRPGIKIDILEAEILAERLQEYKLAEPVKWLVYAAETYQNSSAQYCLGVCYHDGFGVDVNLTKAVYYYELSANQGHARGQGILGYCFAEGVGVQKNPVASFRWYMKAAQQAECVAMYNVGFCLEDGVGCKKDLAEAFYWYSKSAELGNCFAQNSLGYFY
ncbi:HCP-like protein, partial [Rozella allomycis CSF55]